MFDLVTSKNLGDDDEGQVRRGKVSDEVTWEVMERQGVRLGNMRGDVRCQVRCQVR